MATIILGQHADALTVRLTEGDGADLVATLVDSTGAEFDWAAAPTLSFAHSVTRDVIAEHVASIAGPVATWDLSRADVTEIATGSEPRRAGQLVTYARITTPDTGDADGHVEYAGRVDWRDGWTAGERSQRVTFTLPGVPGPAGPPGSGGGTDALTLVDGGTVTLDDTKAEGTLVGYRVKATATFEGEGGTADLAPGAYTFERTDGGWTYYPIAAGTVLGGTVTPVEPGITDTFTMADGNLAGHVPDSGTTSAWSAASGMGYMPTNTPAPPVAGNKIAMSGGTSYGGKLPVPHTSSTVAEFDYTVTPGGPDSNVMFAFGDVDNYIYVSIRQSGDVVAYHYPSFTEYANVSGQPTTARFSFSYIGNAITMRVNGTTVATGSRAMTLVAPHVALGSHGSANVATVDNLSVVAS